MGSTQVLAPEIDLVVTVAGRTITEWPEEGEMVVMAPLRPKAQYLEGRNNTDTTIVSGSTAVTVAITVAAGGPDDRYLHGVGKAQTTLARLAPVTIKYGTYKNVAKGMALTDAPTRTINETGEFATHTFTGKMDVQRILKLQAPSPLTEADITPLL
jgi:hypothetical protein